MLPAAGRAPGSGERMLLASQCHRTLWQKSRCPVHLPGSPKASPGAVSSAALLLPRGWGKEGGTEGSLSCQHPCASTQ